MLIYIRIYYTIAEFLLLSDSNVDLKVTSVQKSVRSLRHQSVPSLPRGFCFL